MIKYDIAIIGGGPAGLKAYELAKNKNLNVCLFEANNTLGGQPTILFPAKLIHDYPEFKEISGNDLMNVFIDRIKDKKDIYLNTTIHAINKIDDGFELIANDCEFKSRFVIIATGGGFFKFNKIDGLEFDNIHYSVKNLDIYKNKKIVICGGGDSAIDWAWEMLNNNISQDISLVHRRDEFRAKGDKLEKVLNSKIKVYLNKTSKVIDKNTLEITDKNTNVKNTLTYDYLLVFFGQTYGLQDNALLNMFELGNLNRIIVNENCCTNINNIYAIGNAALFNNKPRLIYVAVDDANKAINDIARKI